MAFGPINVALHRVSIAVELGRTRDALALADAVAIDEASAVERRVTFHLDVARCYLRERNDVAVIHMLHRAHRESPEELQHNSVARETLRLIAGRAKPSMRVDLQPLLQSASIPD
jgi:hypothetical protein